MPRKRKTADEELNTAPKKRGRGASVDLAVIPGWSPKPSRPDAHKPTDRTRTLVEMMTAYGASQPQIASTLDIDPSTLARHYREQLTLGHMRSNMAVARNLFRIATTPKNTAPVVNAAIWWTKSMMGWREIRDVQAEIRSVNADLRSLTDAQLLELVDQTAGRRTEEAPSGDPPTPEKQS